MRVHEDPLSRYGVVHEDPLSRYGVVHADILMGGQTGGK